MNGAASNPDVHVFAYAAAQVKKAIEVTKELGICFILLEKFLWFSGKLH